MKALAACSYGAALALAALAAPAAAQDKVSFRLNWVMTASIRRSSSAGAGYYAEEKIDTRSTRGAGRARGQAGRERRRQVGLGDTGSVIAGAPRARR